MGRDIEIADTRVIGQREGDRRLLSPLAPPRFQNVREGAGAERVVLERAGDGRGEFLRAVVVEQRQQAGGRGAQGFAPSGEALQERGHAGDREAEAVARTGRIRLARGRHQAGDMRLLLDRLAGVVAARMTRDLSTPAITRTVVAFASSVSGRRTCGCGIE